MSKSVALLNRLLSACLAILLLGVVGATAEEAELVPHRAVYEGALAGPKDPLRADQKIRFERILRDECIEWVLETRTDELMILSNGAGTYAATIWRFVVERKREHALWFTLGARGFSGQREEHGEVSGGLLTLSAGDQLDPRRDALPEGALLPIAMRREMLRLAAAREEMTNGILVTPDALTLVQEVAVKVPEAVDPSVAPEVVDLAGLKSWRVHMELTPYATSYSSLSPVPLSESTATYVSEERLYENGVIGDFTEKILGSGHQQHYQYRLVEFEELPGCE